MKRLSIRMKVTLWFVGALFLNGILLSVGILVASNSVIQKNIQDNLVETVADNVDEIEFYSSLEEMMRYANDFDHYIAYQGGYLEVDDDFLDSVNGIFTSLVDINGRLFYGENPIGQAASQMTLSDGQMQTLRVNGILYYIYDRELTRDGLEGLWLRGIVAETQGQAQLTSIERLSFILLPVLVILAVVGGYMVAGRALRPIKEISAAAAEIHQGGDLKKRIEIGEGKDELHELANNFNQMFERLENAFEAERQFTSDASHELRTPMSVIMAQCEYTMEKPRSVEEYQEALEVINRQGRRMSGLIRDMLDFTRLEGKAESFVKETVDLSELTASVCEDMALVQRRGILLESEIQSGISAEGNRSLLTRLVVNLISNAYRYGKENGHIWVRLKEDEQQIRLTVSDDGIGIAKEDQEKIFSRFYQVDVSRTGRGSGLGLSMVRQIAQFHGGEVSVVSTLGQGSTFIFTLPKKSFSS
nr:HAMP domain-containing sensor histidine kinase [uncultured Acetatifactor sp.]